MEDIRYLVDLDLTKNRLLNVKLQSLVGHPTVSAEDSGFIYWNSTDKTTYIYDGAGEWIDLGSDGTTNLSNTPGADAVLVDSSTGLGTTLAAATSVLAGVMTAADKSKLIGIADGANNYVHPNHTGDVHSVGDGVLSIQPSVVANSMLVNMTANTIKGRVGSVGAPEDLTPTQIRTLINVEDGAQVNVGTDLGNSQTSAYVTITSSTGSSTNIPLATQVLSGLMAPADKLKLDGVEAGADITDFDSVNAAGAVMNSDTSTAAMQFVIDEDTLISDLNTKVPTQSSVKAYVDASIVGDRKYKGGYDTVLDDPALESDSAGVGVKVGWVYTVITAGDFHGETLEIGDVIIAEVDSPTQASDWTIVQGNLTNAVMGPNSAVDNRVAFFDGTSGQLIKDSGLTLLGSNTGDEVPATTEVQGIIELATDIEAALGTDTVRAITPAALKHVLSNSGNTYARTYRTTVGGATSQVVTHDLETRFVNVELHETDSPYAKVITRHEVTSDNTLTVYFNTAPTADQYTIVVTG